MAFRYGPGRDRQVTRGSGFKTGMGIVYTALSAGLGLAACSSTLTYTPAVEMLNRYDQAPPSPSRFAYCYGYGCRTAVEPAQLGDDWAAIEALFASAAQSPAEERARMAETVARFEQSMGARYGTAADKGGTFTSFGRPGQLDCIDEALNTTTLLRMLKSQGLLAWHDVAAPVQRGFIVGSWPHVTAVVVEHQTTAAYAIDSWFRDNGQRADVVPVDAWLDGWAPG